jgi:zinc protease
MPARACWRATAKPALDENQLGEAWADLGAGFGGERRQRPHELHLRSLTYPDLLAKAVHLAARQLGEPSFPTPSGSASASACRRPSAKRTRGPAPSPAAPSGRPSTAATRMATRPPRSRWRASKCRTCALPSQGMVQPCRAKVSVVGAVNRAQADQLVTQLLSRCHRAGACPALPPVPEVPALAAPASLTSRSSRRRPTC